MAISHNNHFLRDTSNNRLPFISHSSLFPFFSLSLFFPKKLYIQHNKIKYVASLSFFSFRILYKLFEAFIYLPQKFPIEESKNLKLTTLLAITHNLVFPFLIIILSGFEFLQPQSSSRNLGNASLYFLAYILSFSFPRNKGIFRFP